MQPSSDPEHQKVTQLWAQLRPVLLSVINRLDAKIKTGLALHPGFMRFQIGEQLARREHILHAGLIPQLQSDFPQEHDEIQKILLSFLEEWKTDYDNDGSSQPQTETRPQEKNSDAPDIPIDFPVIQSQLDLAGFGPVGGIGWWGKFF